MGRYTKSWSKVHQDIFKLYVAGIKPSEIAEKTGYSLDKVRNIIRTDKFQTHHDAVITSSVDAARKLFESRLIEAARQITTLMKIGKPEERLRFDAAKEVLYQCGMKPVEVVETRTRQYTPEEIESSLTVVKEIESIEHKLAKEVSPFLLKPEDEPSATTQATEPIKEEIPVA